MRVGFSLAALVALTASSAAYAQVYSDAVTKMTSALAAQGQMAITTSYPVEIEYEECRIVMSHSREGMDHERCDKKKRVEIRQRTDQALLTPGPISVSFPYPPEFGNTIYTDFPNTLLENSVEMRNCTPGNSNFNIGLSVSASRSHTVGINHSVSNTIGGSANGSFKPFGIGASVTINVSHVETTARAVNDGQQDSYSISHSGNVAVSPRTGIIATLRSYRIQAQIPFKVKAVLDADVSQNDRGIKKASEIIGEPDRTFIIDGIITSTDNSKGFVDMFEIEDACVNRTGTSQSPFVPTNAQRLVHASSRVYKVDASLKKIMK